MELLLACNLIDRLLSLILLDSISMNFMYTNVMLLYIKWQIIYYVNNDVIRYGFIIP